MALRKALPLIQNNMEEFILGGGAKIQSLEIERKKLQTYIQEIERSAALSMNEVGQEMAELRRRIDLKEKEVFVEIDHAKEEVLSRVRELLHLLSTRIEDTRHELCDIEQVALRSSHT